MIQCLMGQLMWGKRDVQNEAIKGTDEALLDNYIPITHPLYCKGVHH